MILPVEQAYVINLIRRPDRLAGFQSRAHWLPVPVQVVPGVDGRELVPDYDWVSTPGARGCQLAHRQILETPGLSAALVFEDDAVIYDDFAERFALLLEQAPADWECLLLGAHVHHSEPVTDELRGGRYVGPAAGPIVRVTRFTGTHGYLLRGQGLVLARRINAIARTHWDIPLGRALGWRGRTYAQLPLTVGISGSRSDVAALA